MKKVIGLVLGALVIVGMAVVCIINGEAIGYKCADALAWINKKFFKKVEKSK